MNARKTLKTKESREGYWHFAYQLLASLAKRKVAENRVNELRFLWLSSVPLTRDPAQQVNEIQPQTEMGAGYPNILLFPRIGLKTGVVDEPKHPCILR